MGRVLACWRGGGGGGVGVDGGVGAVSPPYRLPLLASFAGFKLK